MVTTLGVVFGAWTAATIVLNKRDWVPWLMSATVPFMTTSAITVDDNALPPFFLAAIAPTTLALINFGRSRSGAQFVGLAIGLATFFAVSAAVLPFLFEGRRVVVPRGGLDALGELTPSVSNLAQALYIVLAIGTLVFLVRYPPRHVHFLALGLGLGAVLNLWDLISLHSSLAFPRAIFEQGLALERFPSQFDGNIRLRGLFREPSYLATFALGSFAYFAALAPRLTGVLRILATLAAFVNCAFLYFAYSGTAVAGFAVYSILIGVASWWLTVTGKPDFAVKTVFATLSVGLLAIVFWDTFIARQLSVASSKIGANSFNVRTESDSFSLNLFLDTYGFGVGLGSNRPSSFAVMLLSNVGIVGTILFAALAIRAVRPALLGYPARPEALAFIATLIAKLISEPNLAHPLMWLSLAACAAWVSGPKHPPLESAGAFQFPKQVTEIGNKKRAQFLR